MFPGDHVHEPGTRLCAGSTRVLRFHGRDATGGGGAVETGSRWAWRGRRGGGGRLGWLLGGERVPGSSRHPPLVVSPDCPRRGRGRGSAVRVGGVLSTSEDSGQTSSGALQAVFREPRGLPPRSGGPSVTAEPAQDHILRQWYPDHLLRPAMYSQPAGAWGFPQPEWAPTSVPR